jgi:rod shape-determining protein MreC
MNMTRSKRSRVLWYAAPLSVLSIICMILSQAGYLAKTGQFMDRLTAPAYAFIDKPFAKWNAWSLSAKEHQALIERNAKLRANVMLLKAKINSFHNIETENKQLLALLRSSTKLADKVVVARVMSVNLDAQKQEVLLNKGSEDKVYLGQPVLDAQGIYGQVIRVMPAQSVVLLVNDPHHAIPVEIARNHIRGMAVGNGMHAPMNILYMKPNDDIVVGDKIVSSGLAGRFPAGYPVGVVMSLGNTKKHAFIDVSMQPAAKTRQSRQVLLVWRETNHDKKVAST